MVPIFIVLKSTTRAVLENVCRFQSFISSTAATDVVLVYLEDISFGPRPFFKQNKFLTCS